MAPASSVNGATTLPAVSRPSATANAIDRKMPRPNAPTTSRSIFLNAPVSSMATNRSPRELALLSTSSVRVATVTS